VRVIADFNTWPIVHTDYRRPLNTFATTISAVVGLYFYLLVLSTRLNNPLRIRPDLLLAATIPADRRPSDAAQCW
jgi:hypothetical protein